MIEQTFKQKCFNYLCLVVRNDEALNLLIENGTVVDSDFEEANDYLCYIFNQFDCIENFIPSTICENIRDVYLVNYLEIYEFLKLELI